MSLLDTISPFVDAGFAIHWLKARDKAPAGGDGWQDAPVATVEDLRQTHFPNANVGVRLGEPSCLDGPYLHVVDLDIRIPDLADEAWSAFANLFPHITVTDFPSVISGSAGESRHLYFVTDRPFYGKKLAVSEGKHRRFDRKKKKEVWSYDWEIDLFGTGRQVAMPPSIHPDSGKPYVWERPFDLDALALGCAPSIDGDTVEALGVAETVEYAFETREPLKFKPGELESELEWLEMHYWDGRDSWITIGQALHHQYGGSDEGFEIWMMFSKRSVNFDPDKEGEARVLRKQLRRYRGFGKNRRQPVTMGTIMLWVGECKDRYKDKQFLDECDDLDAETVEDPPESDPFADLLGDTSSSPVPSEEPWNGGDLTEEEQQFTWTSLIALNKNAETVANLHNIELIIKNDVRIVGLPQVNSFTMETVQRTPPGTKPKKRKNQAKPTRQLEGPVWEVKDTVNGENWSSARDYAIRSIIEAPSNQGGYGIKVSDRDLKAAVVLAAWQNCFHPVREYLSGLTWDGTPRMDRLFIDFLGAEDTPYSRNVARLMMVAAVARVFEPGCKWDYAVILEGIQGAGKSTFIRTLGRRWFSELEGNFHDGKEMVEKIQGSWIVEIPELSGFSRSDVQSIKAFISRQCDKVRLAYEARAADFPRQCVLIGSTNDKEYLRDPTGGRRFFPMECHVKSIDNVKMRQDIDQLWAEAFAVYTAMRVETPVEQGDLPLYMADAEAAEEAARLQESRRVESADDATAGQIGAWLSAPITTGSIDEDTDAAGKPLYRTETCLIEVWCECLGNERKTYGQVGAQMLGRAMRLIPGWDLAAGKTRFAKYGQQRFYTKGGDAQRAGRMGILKFSETP